MEGGLHTLVTWSKDLKDVKLAASTRPARTVGLTVLQSTWDLSVEHPDGGHVHWVVDVGGGLAGVGHLELEEEGLLGAVESLKQAQRQFSP